MPGYLLGRLLGLPSYRDKTTAIVLTAQDVLYKSILVVLTVSAILWMAIFLYASFYYYYMPAVSHSRPIHLQFESCKRDQGMCSFPAANVTLTEKEQILMGGQPYQVVVELEMPESPSNQRLGMFMVCAELKDSVSAPVQKSCRATMLQYKSSLLHTMSAILLFPFLFLGSVQEKQLVSVELFSNFEESSMHPVTEAFIEIQTQHAEIYRSYLKIHAHFVGLRYIMFHWPVLSAVIGITTNIFFLTIIAFLSWYKFFTPKQVVVHVGYDSGQAQSFEERRAQARERLRLERQRAALHSSVSSTTTTEEKVGTSVNDESPKKDNDDFKSGEEKGRMSSSSKPEETHEEFEPESKREDDENDAQVFSEARDFENDEDKENQNLEAAHTSSESEKQVRKRKSKKSEPE